MMFLQSKAFVCVLYLYLYTLYSLKMNCAALNGIETPRFLYLLFPILLSEMN